MVSVLFAQAKHEFYITHVGIGNDGVISEGTLAFSSLLGKNVILESLGAFYFSGAGYLEPLFSTGIGFHFRHICISFIFFLWVQAVLLLSCLLLWLAHPWRRHLGWRRLLQLLPWPTPL